MLISQVPVRVAVPHEPGAWFEFAMPSWKELEEARKTAVQKNPELLKEFGAAFVEAFRSVEESELRTWIQEHPYFGPVLFDVETMLTRGVVAWSYSRELSPETLAGLDDETTVWAMRTLKELSRDSDPAECVLRDGKRVKL